jgi:hypothetical protein
LPFVNVVMVSKRVWMEASGSTVKGRVSMPALAREVRVEAERAVVNTRRPWEWKVRASEWPIPPGEQLYVRITGQRFECRLVVRPLDCGASY